MTDERGYYVDVGSLVKWSKEQVDIRQMFEMEKEKTLREYPHKSPGFLFVFDRFLYFEEQMKDPNYQFDAKRFLEDHPKNTNTDGEILIGAVLFRAYPLE